MKPLLSARSTAVTRKRASRGLTLTEMMVTVSLFSISVLGLLYCQIFGMRADQLINSKSGACEQARLSFNDLTTDIRAAKIWQIGNADATTFTPIDMGQPQQGNAIRLSLTTDTNNYTIYYFDTSRSELRRRHDQSSSVLLAGYLTNTMYFRAETPRGDVQTDITHKGVIDVAMQFYQYQYPVTRIGPGYYYDYYKLELRVTPHVPDGI